MGISCGNNRTSSKVKFKRMGKKQSRCSRGCGGLRMSFGNACNDREWYCINYDFEKGWEGDLEQADFFCMSERGLRHIEDEKQS